VVSWWGPIAIALASVLASSGFWAFVLKKDTNRNATTRLLMGLAYDKVTNRGMAYIERGWITRDEFEEYQRYFVEPYKALGGNGVAERIYLEVGKLPFLPHSRYEIMFADREDERFISDVPVASNSEKYASDER
jgi:hypothetical protein